MNQKNNNSKNENEDFGRFDFVGLTPLFGGISLVLSLVFLVYLTVNGINYGIDFRGGTEIQVKFGQSVEIDNLRKSTEGLGIGEVGIQGFGDGNEFIFRFQGIQGKTDKETNENLSSSIAKVRTMLETQFGAQQPDIRRVDTVGPQVGAELKRNGFLSIFYCLLVILIYVSLRFDYKYSPGAVICLIHDVILTMGIFVLVGKEVNVSILAAILSLIGFSLNDVIVVFDRIRETESMYKNKSSKFIVNKAVNDMLGRTIITAGTVFTSALCLWIFSEGTVADIAFAITIGMFFGTYSSVFVAAPLMIFIEKMKFLAKA
ncbi:MAG: protein translocase subunit SecF [Bdellovibrionaceae bacterium]|nr:protein translocase subunit SecF [Pseudobdellovibrionaceae bacterium]